MIEIANIDELRKKATRRYVIHIILISLLILASIAGVVLSLLFSKLDYTLNLIINIVVSALVIIFTIFYFLNIFPIVLYYFKLYKNVNEIALEKRRNVTFLEEKENKTIHNVKHRVLVFSYKEGEEIYKEDLYVLDSDITFKPEQSYRIESFHNVIMRYKENSDATN